MASIGTNPTTYRTSGRRGSKMAQNLGTMLREAGVVFTKLPVIDIPTPKDPGPVKGNPLQGLRNKLIVRRIRNEIAKEKSDG